MPPLPVSKKAQDNFTAPVPRQALEAPVTPVHPRLLDRDRNVHPYGRTKRFHHLPTGMTPRRSDRSVCRVVHGHSGGAAAPAAAAFSVCQDGVYLDVFADEM